MSGAWRADAWMIAAAAPAPAFRAERLAETTSRGLPASDLDHEYFKEHA